MPPHPPSPLLAWLRQHPQAKLLLYLPTLVWAGLIFWFSSQSYLPELPESWQDFILKKTAHFLVYAGLYFWLWWGTYLPQFLTTPTPQPLTKLQVIWLLLIAVLYAASDELHQAFTVNRHPSPRDVIIDLMGASTLAFCLQHHFQWPQSLKTRLNWLIPS